MKPGVVNDVVRSVPAVDGDSRGISHCEHVWSPVVPGAAMPIGRGCPGEMQR